MKLHPKYQSMGMGEQDAPFILSFNHTARQMGLTQKQTDAVYEFYRDNIQQWGRLSAEDMVGAFQRFLAANQFSDSAAEQMANWLTNTDARVSKGLPPELPATSPEQDARRVSELQKMIRENPEKYFESGAADELYEILARQEDSAGSEQAPNNQAPSQSQAGRRAELEQMMRDGSPKYWQSEAAQTEYRQILGGDQTLPGATPATPGDASHGADSSGAAGGPASQTT